LLRHHWRWRSSTWQSLGQPVAVWQQQRQQCLWRCSSGSLGIGWQFFAEQNGQSAAAAFGCGGSLFLSSASTSIWQVVALCACGTTRLWRYVLAAWQHPFLSSSSASICGCGRESCYALAALCALCATHCLLGLCPQGTRRGLVGAGGEVGLCPWPVSAAGAGREHYAACFMHLRLGKWATRLVLTI
jgi:hypothetical protein